MLKMGFSTRRPPNVKPCVLVVGGGNGLSWLTGIWQTVRGPSNPFVVNQLATETDDQRNKQPQDEGEGIQLGDEPMTAQHTSRPLLNPKSKCRGLCSKQERLHR